MAKLLVPAVLVALMHARTVLADEEPNDFLDEGSGRLLLVAVCIAGVALIAVLAYCIWYVKKGPSPPAPQPQMQLPMYGQPGMPPQGPMMQPSARMVMMPNGMIMPAAPTMVPAQPNPLPVVAGSGAVSHRQLPTINSSGFEVQADGEVSSPVLPAAASPVRRTVRSVDRPAPAGVAGTPALNRIMSANLAPLSPGAGDSGALAAQSPVTPRGIREYRQQLAENPQQSFHLNDDERGMASNPSQAALQAGNDVAAGDLDDTSSSDDDDGIANLVHMAEEEVERESRRDIHK